MDEEAGKGEDPLIIRNPLRSALAPFLWPGLGEALAELAVTGCPLGVLDQGMNSVDLLEDYHSKFQGLSQLQARLRRNLGGWARAILALGSLVLVLIDLSASQVPTPVLD